MTPRSAILIGKVLVAVSTILYIAVFLLVPFLPLNLGTKAWLAGGLVVLGEVTFWVGAFLLGKEFIKKYRQRFDPRQWLKGWRRQRGLLPGDGAGPAAAAPAIEGRGRREGEDEAD